MKEVTAFQADDGQIFGTASECRDHEISLQWNGRIASFLNSDLNPYPGNSQSMMARKAIVAWERFKAGEE